MCRAHVPELFGIMSFFTVFSLAVLCLTNMIVSILSPKEFDTFIEANYTDDYKTSTNYELLLDLNFGSKLEIKYDYDIIGTIENLCYIGICNLDSTNKVTKNCSDSCLTSTKYCYDGENRCNSKKCIISSRYETNSSCHEFNRIQFWRNIEFFRNIENYKVIPYYDIIPKDQSCRYGYKKCGIINENKDYLCIKKGKEFDCPINDIIVKSNNESIEEGYRSFKLGDKFLFVSNNKTDNCIIKNISITLDINKASSDLKKVDNDTYENLSNYNYINLYSIDQPELAFLNAVPYKSNFTYEQMMKTQGIIDRKKETYTREKLNEMNSEVFQHKTLLFALGIAIFASAGVFTILIFCLYGDCDNDCDCNCCEKEDCLCGYKTSPIVFVIVFYIIGIPILVMLIYSFILTIKKKITYNKLSSMECIEEYKNLFRNESVSTYGGNYEIRLVDYDLFENSIEYNNRQFIVLLIALIILILYPIATILFFSPKKEVKSISFSSQDTNDKRLTPDQI